MSLPRRVQRLPLTEEEKEHLRPISLDELDKLMDELDEAPPAQHHLQTPSIAQQPFTMTTPAPASNGSASPIVINQPAKDPTRTQLSVSVEIQRYLPLQPFLQPPAMTAKAAKPAQKTTPSTPKTQKTVPASTPPSPTPTTLTTPVKRSLNQTLAMESKTPSKKQRKTPRKPATTNTNATTATATATATTTSPTPANPNPNPSTSPTPTPSTSTTTTTTTTPSKRKTHPIPPDWPSTTAEDRLLFQLKKAGESWKDIATELNRVTGQEYSQKALAGRWHRIKAKIGLPPGLDLDFYSSGGDSEEIG